MKILTKYMIREVVGPFFFGLFAFTSMFLGFLFLNLLRDAEEYRFSITFIIQLMSLMIPQYLAQGAPIAVLLGTLLGIGNLTGHSETIAMRAGGLSYKSLALPVLFIGLAVTSGCILLNEYVVPASNRIYEKMKVEAIRKEATATIYHFNKDFYEKGVLKKLVYADSYEPKLQKMSKVTIQEFDQGKLIRTISAADMSWNGQGWFFNNGQIFQYYADSLYPIKVDKGRVRYDLKLTPSEIEKIKEDPENKSISELAAYIEKFVSSGQEKQRLLVDLHMKFSIPFASFIFALLGTPLALRPQRRSNAAGFGLCIIFILVWYALMGVGTSLARAGSLPAFVGAWLPNIVLAGYGIGVFSKVKS